jgi:HlyD family type I secretion membrane fusion protein
MTVDIKRPSQDIRQVAVVGLGIIVVTFGVVGLWAALVPLGSAVTGTGVVVVESNRQLIQHFEGGIVGKVATHEGDHVRAGQVLFELSPVQTNAALATARNQLFSLLARADRLAAERDNRPAVVFSRETEDQKQDPLVAAAVTDQLRQFKERRATIEAQDAVLKTRISEYRTQIQGIDVQSASMRRQVSLLNDELGSLEPLYKEGLVPQPRILETRRELAQLEGQIGSATSERAKTEQSIGETELQINEVHRQFYQDVGREITDVATQIGDNRQKFAVAQDAAHRVSITAPMDGVVQNLHVFTVGGVVRPGEALAEIAPDHGRMMVEARFSPNDVDSVRAGQVVEVRFSTFHSRTIPVIEGTVRSMSQDRLTDEASHQPYYVAMVEVPEGHLPDQIKGKLRAGLPAQVIAPTGSRTALQYAFGPLSNALTHAMRER